MPSRLLQQPRDYEQELSALRKIFRTFLRPHVGHLGVDDFSDTDVVGHTLQLLTHDASDSMHFAPPSSVMEYATTPQPAKSELSLAMETYHQAMTYIAGVLGLPTLALDVPDLSALNHSQEAVVFYLLVYLICMQCGSTRAEFIDLMDGMAPGEQDILMNCANRLNSSSAFVSSSTALAGSMTVTDQQQSRLLSNIGRPTTTNFSASDTDYTIVCPEHRTTWLVANADQGNLEEDVRAQLRRCEDNVTDLETTIENLLAEKNSLSGELTEARKQSKADRAALAEAERRVHALLGRRVAEQTFEANYEKFASTIKKYLELKEKKADVDANAKFLSSRCVLLEEKVAEQAKTIETLGTLRKSQDARIHDLLYAKGDLAESLTQLCQRLAEADAYIAELEGDLRACRDMQDAETSHTRTDGSYPSSPLRGNLQDTLDLFFPSDGYGCSRPGSPGASARLTPSAEESDDGVGSARPPWHDFALFLRGTGFTPLNYMAVASRYRRD
ncbi:hypothetical protein CYLTODRAFT_481795 [Cylindrobasidium torrendii FP15055 ss-10]|uniref:Uncharacterized protein n=1 Tax=Cylindrobasidium torrendii FP15055 ss-10 TaxID=1314674 RepID=A0A0D7ARS0_9AGAR|nr:hypothetical protein CYLTODRAFT_481795 [Cylindrobasidium torrendii FP15055 ss-10]